MAGNNIYVQGSYIDVHDNENVYLSVDKAMVNMGQDARDGGLLKDGGLQQDSRQLSDGRLARAIECSQAFFWGNSSYAVVFCVCRDDYGMPPNKTAFERRMQQLPFTKKLSHSCTTGTLTNAFSNNRVYDFHVDKWESLQASPRAIKLRDELRRQLASQL